MNRATYSEFEFASQLRERDAVRPDPGGALRDIFARVGMYRGMILCVAVSGVLAGIGYGFTRTPKYTATAQIILSPPAEAASSPGGDAKPLPSAQDTSVMGSEVEVLRSTGVITRLVNKVGVQTAGGWVEQPFAPLVAPLVERALGPARPRTYTAADVDAVVRDIRAMLTIARKDRTYVVEVAAAAARPADAAALVNALSQVYADSKLEERTGASRSASAWLSERVTTLKADLAAREAEIAAYRAQMAHDGDGLADSQLGAIQQGLIDAAAAYTEKKARLDQLNRLIAAGGSMDLIAAGLNTPAVVQLQQAEAAIATRQADLEQRFSATHPDVVAVRDERAAARQKLDSEIARALANLQAEVVSGRLRVEDLKKTQREIVDKLVDASRGEVKLRDLQRQVDAASGVYQQYLIQLRESEAAASRRLLGARILSAATAPDRPATMPIWVWPPAFGAAGLLTGVLFALVRGLLNNRLMRPEDVQRKLRKTALVSIPLVSDLELRNSAPDERSPASAVVGKPMSRLAESVRVLLTQIMATAIDGQGMVVVVTSAVAKEGKTTTAMSLGRVAAMSGLKVLMVEGDLRELSLSRFVLDPSSSDKPDLVAALRGEIDWRKAVTADPATEAHILPATAMGRLLGNPFATPRMRTILDEVRDAYELIILDGPPVLAVADARSLAAVADGAVLVSNWNETPVPAVRAAIREVEAVGGRMIGVLLNRIKPDLVRRISSADPLYFGAAGSKYYSG